MHTVISYCQLHLIVLASCICSKSVVKPILHVFRLTVAIFSSRSLGMRTAIAGLDQPVAIFSIAGWPPSRCPLALIARKCRAGRCDPHLHSLCPCALPGGKAWGIRGEVQLTAATGQLQLLSKRLSISLAGSFSSSVAL